MKDFLYAHADGRVGEGSTTWQAIVAAVGSEEAYTWNDLLPSRWYDTDAADGEYIDIEQYPRKTAVISGDVMKGMLFERRRD